MLLSEQYCVYTDSSGAEYRLDINNNSVWSSREGVYVYYDANSQRLYFRDGTFWAMGSVSAGTEEDAGTMYPTIVEDSNGNQILITYRAGAGVSWTNSSVRINSIEDVRTTGVKSYEFTYNNDPVPHLTQLVDHISAAESYAFTYQPLRCMRRSRRRPRLATPPYYRACRSSTRA